MQYFSGNIKEAALPYSSNTASCVFIFFRSARNRFSGKNCTSGAVPFHRIERADLISHLELLQQETAVSAAAARTSVPVTRAAYRTRLAPMARRTHSDFRPAVTVSLAGFMRHEYCNSRFPVMAAVSVAGIYSCKMAYRNISSATFTNISAGIILNPGCAGGIKSSIFYQISYCAGTEKAPPRHSRS